MLQLGSVSATLSCLVSVPSQGYVYIGSYAILRRDMSSARGYFLGVGWGGKSKTPLEWEKILSCEERCLDN